MEPPKGFLASLWSFICFLPFFIGLLLLGLIKGVILCPLICLMMTVGNACIILVLWPMHAFYTYYSILSAKQLGPILKLVLCVFIPVPLISWPLVGIVGSIIGGAGYGLLSPMFATVEAVGEGKSDPFFHAINDGIESTVKGCFTFIRDFMDVCYHSYLSLMNDLRTQVPLEGKCYEIRLLYLPCALLAGVLGFLVDMPVISLIATFKSPYMLFKGWHRLLHDLIGREGPFLETICVPFAGLAILLWPLAVVGAVLGSMVSSLFLGAYAAVVVYQESSLWYGLRYIVASISIYDEYSNDLLDMMEGSCFPRPKYRRKASLSRTTSRTSSLSKSNSMSKKPPSRTTSIKKAIEKAIELGPLELLDGLFQECRSQGDIMISEGLITLEVIEDSTSNKGGGGIISVGLPAYCLLLTLLQSVKANSVGILLSDGTEITSTNRPKDAVFDWFLNPLLIIKEQIKAAQLSAAEEDYLGKLVLLSGDPKRLKNSNIGPAPDSERKRAELDALARRLQGITRSISRYPTFKRKFDCLVKKLVEDLAKKNCRNEPTPGPIARSKSAFVSRIFSQKSFKNKTNNQESDPEIQLAVDRDVEIT